MDRHLLLVAVMIEVTSRRRSALIQTPTTVGCLPLRFMGTGNSVFYLKNNV